MKIIKNKKFIILLRLLFLIFLIINLFFHKSNINRLLSLKINKRFINDCKKSINYKRIKIINQSPYFSICLSALNMENYIKRALLSILNQSFQDFEIIIINDNSNDNTENIINKMRFEDNRITCIYHQKNMGVYSSRIEAILLAKGKYIILMDPDDMFLNENLLKILYNYNLKLNLDIVEFTVFREIEDSKLIFYPDIHFKTHYHNFSKKIIYQPELSEILFYIPNTKNYSHTICRNIWNKMINRKIFLKAIKYIGSYYLNQFVITADDILMNLIVYHYANNYSNIEIPGYLYNIRKASMSHGDGGNELNIIRSINYFLYFQILYKYIKEFKKCRNFLYFEMEDFKQYILDIKNYNVKKYIPQVINYLNEIINDKYVSYFFRNYTNQLLLYFQTN